MANVKESTVKVERIGRNNVELLAVVVGVFKGEPGRIDIKDEHMTKVLNDHKQYRLSFGEYEDGDAFIELTAGHPEELTEEEQAEQAKKQEEMLAALIGQPLSAEAMQQLLGGGQ